MGFVCSVSVLLGETAAAGCFVGTSIGQTVG